MVRKYFDEEILDLKNYERYREVIASDSIRMVKSAGARMSREAILDFTKCEDMKKIDLVNADFRAIRSLSLPENVVSICFLGTIFPEHFVLDLSKQHKLSSLNLYFAQNLQEVVVSDKLSRKTFYNLAESLPENGIVLRRANGEIGYKGKKFDEYKPDYLEMMYMRMNKANGR